MFEIETGLIFWNTVSFAILVFIMYKWVMPPMLAVLAERQRSIAESVSKAEETNKKSEELLLSYKEKLAESNRVASTIVEQAKTEGEKLKSEILKRAESQADIFIEQAKQDISTEKNKIISEAKKEISEIVAMAAGKVIGRVFSKEDNKRIIEEALQ